MSVSKIFSCFKLPLLLSFIAVSLLACDKMVIGTSTGNMEVKELSEKEKLETQLGIYKNIETSAKNERDAEQKKIKKLEKDRRDSIASFIRNSSSIYYPSERKGKTYSNYKATSKQYCSRGGSPTPNRGPCLMLTDHNKKIQKIDRDLEEAKKKLKNAKEKLSNATKGKAAPQKRLAEIEEAEKAAQAAEQLATETAVEAYTEESRWEGATDYSQSCSSSSGDLGCGGGVE